MYKARRNMFMSSVTPWLALTGQQTPQRDWNIVLTVGLLWGFVHYGVDPGTRRKVPMLTTPELRAQMEHWK